ncbi:hypothetical protein [Palleronia sp. LCG004]|uniref:hypothetical protein n=1 Tax=Palleronia sp. LCG004 TaxID=3079304 RepID=UPI002943DDDC|nr:hypothetical protein [Palleronia sp. LCG004]WOI58292.1 hypothetical protein RVY76_17420 [Palleronia sp. LCG004]
MNAKAVTCFLLFGLSACMTTEADPGADAEWTNEVVERPDFDQSSEATRMAEAACREALATRLARPVGDTRVEYVLDSEAGLGVWMSARGVEGQWTCQSDAAGNVAGLGEASVP